MTYATGQPIIFIGTGQVGRLYLILRSFDLTFFALDIYRPSPVTGIGRRAGLVK